jgi:hypothetical protein
MRSVMPMFAARRCLLHLRRGSVRALVWVWWCVPVGSINGGF